MNRETQSFVLVLLGGSVLGLALTDQYLRYVKAGLHPFLLAAGVIVLMLGAVGFLSADARPGDGPGHEHPGDRLAPLAADTEETDPALDGGHDHAHGPRVAWLLVLPVLALSLVAPPALGSYAAERDSAAVAAPENDDGYDALPPGDPVELAVFDYASRAVWDGEQTLAGREVALTGFASPREGGGWYLVRIGVSCCAADGSASKVEVRGAPAPATDTWVRLTGTWTASAVDGDAAREAVIVAASVEAIPPPANTYE